MNTETKTKHTAEPWMLLAPVDVARLRHLFLKHVGTGPLDADLLRGAIRREKRNAEKGFIRVSPGLLTELRSEYREVGQLQNKIANALRLLGG